MSAPIYDPAMFARAQQAVRVNVRSALGGFTLALGASADAGSGAGGGGGSAGSSLSDRFLSWLRPAVTVEAHGVPVAAYAPHGDPPGWGQVLGVALLCAIPIAMAGAGYYIGTRKG